MAAAATLADPSTDLVSLARLAGRHLVTPMLMACIADPELRQRVPGDFRLYLEFIYVENSRRNDALRRQLRQAAVCLNRIDIEPLLLKGAIRLVDGLYPEPAWRFMHDLDLLIPRDRLRRGVACLASLGYRFTRNAADFRPDHRHVPPLGRDGDHAVFEIHADPLFSREILPAEHVLARSRLVNLDGALVRLPDATDQLGNLIGHDAFDENLGRSGSFLLRSAFETALLCRNECVPRELLARFANTPLARYVRVQVALAAHLFPNYFARPLDFGLKEALLARVLISLERLDKNARLRQTFGYGRFKRLTGKINGMFITLSAASRPRTKYNRLSEFETTSQD